MATNYQLLSSSASSVSDDSSGEDMDNGKKMDFSYHELDDSSLAINLNDTVTTEESRSRVQKLLLYNNILEGIPFVISTLSNLTLLDLSNNLINHVPETICELRSLTHLYLRNNEIGDGDLPKDLSRLSGLRDLNMSGNRLRTMPPQLFQLTGLRNLFIGGNQLTEVPKQIKELKRLRVLYLGGNFIKELPPQICQLHNLQALLLSQNRLEALPSCICNLRKLKCLQLHENKLTTLPHGLIFLSSLTELSLRDNPLVVRFIREMAFQPASLLELSARAVKNHGLPFQDYGLPRGLVNYLSMARSCVNPQCQGVFFDARVEHIKFVDFCGMYKIPLMQYLCSSRCKSGSPAVRGGQAALSSSVSCPDEFSKMRRVLLG